MAQPHAHMIGIRTGGVFSGKTDVDDMKKRIKKIIIEMRNDDNVYTPDLGNEEGDPSHCMSKELESHKGAYVTIAGVFNFWNFKDVSEFVKRISEEFGVEVMHMAHNEGTDEVQCQIWLAGKPMFEVCENPIGRTLRRVT